MTKTKAPIPFRPRLSPEDEEAARVLQEVEDRINARLFGAAPRKRTPATRGGGTMAKKDEALSRLADMGASISPTKTTAAGVAVRKGPGGRPPRFPAGFLRFSVNVSPEDHDAVNRFALWLSAREGKRIGIADTLLIGLKDSKLFREFTAGK